MEWPSDMIDVIVTNGKLYCYISWEEGSSYRSTRERTTVGQETKRNERSPKSGP